jgi:hypothetical protein
MPSTSRLVFCAVAVNAWWKFDGYVHDGYIVGKFETKDTVTMADGTAGLVGELLDAKCSMLTPTFVVLHMIST